MQKESKLRNVVKICCRAAVSISPFNGVLKSATPLSPKFNGYLRHRKFLNRVKILSNGKRLTEHSYKKLSLHVLSPILSYVRLSYKFS